MLMCISSSAHGSFQCSIFVKELPTYADSNIPAWILGAPTTTAKPLRSVNPIRLLPYHSRATLLGVHQGSRGLITSVNRGDHAQGDLAVRLRGLYRRGQAIEGPSYETYVKKLLGFFPEIFHRGEFSIDPISMLPNLTTKSNRVVLGTASPEYQKFVPHGITSVLLADKIGIEIHQDHAVIWIRSIDDWASMASRNLTDKLPRGEILLRELLTPKIEYESDGSSNTTVFQVVVDRSNLTGTIYALNQLFVSQFD